MPLAPTGPGLGVRIDEARLRKRTVNLQRAC
jgi:L-alanine-DL-glutamate epimerase-like enolase superfamily enzyme